MRWRVSHRFDPVAAKIADRHYSRQTPGSPQFSPPGRLVVLLSGEGNDQALWVSNFQEFPLTEFMRDAWTCPLFRNEGAGLSSELIREAMAATRWKWGDPPENGMVTFVDEGKVRRKRDPGRCFLRAGFYVVRDEEGNPARTKVREHLVLRIDPDDIPEPQMPVGAQTELFRGEA